MKNKSWKIAYLIIVLVLIAAITFGLWYVWGKCEEYQQKSANTLVEQAESALEAATGMELKASLVPKSGDGSNYEYILKNGDRSVAKVTLEQTGSGIMNLAHFELKDVSSLLTYNIIFLNGDEISVLGESSDYSGNTENYCFASTQTLYDAGFDLPEYKLFAVKNAYDISQIRVSRDNEELKLIKLDEYTYFATKSIPDVAAATIRERVAELSDAYSHFICTDIDFWQLNGYILSGSPLVERFSTLEVQWYDYHTNARNEDLKVSDPVYLSDRYAMVAAGFDFHVDYYGEEQIVPTELTYILHLADDGYWYMAELATSVTYEGLELTAQRDYINPYSFIAGKYPYYIKVNRGSNCVTVYTIGEDGDYSVPVKSFICSTGKQDNETPEGDYYIQNFRPPFPGWCLMVDGSSGQFTSGWYGGYLFHTICYYQQDPSTMITEEYNMLGDYASLGCVRLQTIDARWIYDNCMIGTPVTVYYDDENPGPLGKPDRVVDYISPEMDNGWDPTDPRPANPWRQIL